MIKVLFVCHGNICRSPMAEFILKSKRSDIHCESRSTSSEEIGNDIYPPIKKVLDNHNIPYTRHYATRFTIDDYENFDYIIVMDDNNLHNLNRMVVDKNHKISKLLNKDIEDPWWTNNYEKVYQEINQGIEELVNKL